VATCPTTDPGVDFPQVTSDASIYSTPESALAYLNQGGDPATLEERLIRQVEPATGVFHHQVTHADLTGDDLPELVLALTFSFGPADPTRGDSTLVVYRCDTEQYRMDTLFVRAGAGDRGEGLFAGGGVRVLDVRDMNASGPPDLVFASFWAAGEGYAEYYIGEWSGDHFEPLIRTTDILGIERTMIPAGWDYEISDVDQDGTSELVFPSYPDPLSNTGGVISPAIFAWDGTSYTLQIP
jgi:hypothetical protein